MREGTSFTIRDSRVLGGTRHVKIYRCYMLKSQGNGVVLWLGRVRNKRKENKETKKILPTLGCLAWIRPKQKKERNMCPCGVLLV